MYNKFSPEPFNEESILNTDLYKLTMQWCVMQNFPDSVVKYQFFDRNDTIYPKGFAAALQKIIASYANRRLSKQRKKELAEKCPYLPAAYLDFLEGYVYDPSEVSVYQDDNGKLKINIEGYHYRTILWEVSLMQSICQLFYQMTGQIVDVDSDTIKQTHIEKANFFKINAVKFADFGTRRAYSARNQHNVVKTFIDYAGDVFIGTSNVELGCAYNTKILGTYAHEFISGISSQTGYLHGNKHAMDTWVKTYQGNLGIALSDTFTTEAFLKDFSSFYANLFTGVRHDSGDPLKFIDMMIDHYKKLGIDPSTKSIVFSDGLNLEEVTRIEKYRPREIRRTYGIGTFFTNDIPGIKPMNIVIKMTECNGAHVIKISDNPKKAIGDPKTIEYTKWVLGITE